jgi:hypothetical protein
LGSGVNGLNKDFQEKTPLKEKGDLDQEIQDLKERLMNLE